jgi:hypothetical protein
MSKNKLQTNLLGRKVYLSEENAQAAGRHLEHHVKDDPYTSRLPPYVALYPDGGEVVAVHADKDGLNITVAAQGKMVTLSPEWLRLEENA